MLLSHMHGAELFLISSGRGAFVNVSQSLPFTCQLCGTKSCVDVRSAGNIFVNSQLAGSRLVPVTCMLQLGSSPTETTQSISRSENAAEANYLMLYAVFKKVIFKQRLSRHFPEFMCENTFV